MACSSSQNEDILADKITYYYVDACRMKWLNGSTMKTTPTTRGMKIEMRYSRPGKAWVATATDTDGRRLICWHEGYNEAYNAALEAAARADFECPED